MKKQIVLVAAVAAVLLSGFFLFSYSSEAKGEKKWEYCVKYGRNPTYNDGAKVLNDLGNEGWELVTVDVPSPAEGEVIAFIFKREKK